MEYRVTIQSRLWIGLAVGWSYYPMDENYEANQLTFLLGLFALNIQWKDRE